MKEKISVLVAIPTNRIKYYCLGKLLHSLKKLRDANEVVFADDTHDKDKNPFGTTDKPDSNYASIIEKAGFKVIRVAETIECITPPRIRQRLVNTRKCLREYFLKSKHTHMLFIDSDVIVPADTIQRLLDCNADIASGIYWQRNQTRGIYAVIFKYQDKESHEIGLSEFGIPLSFGDLIPSRVIGDGDIFITAIGFGCCLVTRKVLTDTSWQFRWKEDEPDRPTTEDMWWSIDMTKLGYRIFAHTGVLCQHHPKAWEGPI